MDEQDDEKKTRKRKPAKFVIQAQVTTDNEEGKNIYWEDVESPRRPRHRRQVPTIHRRRT